MSNNLQFSDKLREQLHLLFPDSKDASGKREVAINCPLCIKEGLIDKGHHMYISLGLDGKPPMYNCFRNINHRGVLTKEALEMISGRSDISDETIAVELEKHNKKASNLSRYRLNKDNKLFLNTPKSNKNKLNDFKLKYINDRLGLNLTYQELVDNKIILSIYDFFRYNKITTFTRSKNILDLLDKFFIGFLNNTNTAIVFRNLMNKEARSKVHKSLDTRYVKYSIIDTSVIGYYIIPTKCDIYKHIDIHIAEGTFDILSVFYNLRNKNTINNIYSSIGGNTYISLIKYFLCTIGLVDVTFHIYIDNDIDNFVLKNIKKKLIPIGINAYIHMNIFEGEKDFGVSPDKIKEYVYKLC